MNDGVRGRYYAWRTKHPQWADVPIDAFTDVYRYGASSALRASAEFAGVVQAMRELVWWFEAGTEDADAVRWAESNALAEEHAIRANGEGGLEDLPF